MNARSGIEAAFVLVFIIVLVLLIPGDAFQNWYERGKAQIVVTHDVTFFNDDIIGNAFSWVGENVFVPIWNFAFGNDVFRNFIAPALVTAFFGVLIADIWNAMKEPGNAAK